MAAQLATPAAGRPTGFVVNAAIAYLLRKLRSVCDAVARYATTKNSVIHAAPK